MANADNNENLPEDKETKSKGNDAQATKQLAEVQEQLRTMNARMEETMAALAAANTRTAPPVQREEQNLYDPNQMVQHVEKIFDTRLREEKSKDMTIYNLAQDYPEIQTDPKVRQAVLDAQKTVPTHLQGTAEGYELAVLKATTKAGLIPKSQRKVVEDDPSYDGTRRAPAARKRVKLSDEMLEAAERMGRDINDPEVLKRLEEAANRDTYSKYR